LNNYNLKIHGINSNLNIEVEAVTMSLNENYILFISKLLDENFDDSCQLIATIKSLSNKSDEVEI